MKEHTFLRLSLKRVESYLAGRYAAKMAISASIKMKDCMKYKLLQGFSINQL